MGNFTYENQGINTYLVYTPTEDEHLDSMSLGMITNNEIPGLASSMFMQMNAVKYIKYNISSKIPVSQLFSGPVSKKRLLGVFYGIVDAMLSAEDYMISAGMIVLDSDYIYADVSTCETVLVCLPIKEKEQSQIDLAAFFKTIIFRTQFDQTENCDHVTKIINYLNSAYIFSLADFKELLKEFQSKEREIPKPQTFSGSLDPILKKPKQQNVLDPFYSKETASAVDEQPKQRVISADVGLVENVQQPKETMSFSKDLSASDTDKNEKSISLIYLLQHYNKVNAGIYKAQKEEKKKAQKEKKRISKRRPKKEEEISDFVKPGQNNSSSISIAAKAGLVMPGMSTDLNSVNEQALQGLSTGVLYASTASQQIFQSAKPSQNSLSLVTVEAGGTADFGNTVFLGENEDGNNETIIMSAGNAAPPIHPHLIRRKNNERIPIGQSMFRMGRNQDFNDYVVIGNDFVGNTHCHILIRGEEYFIVDDNSKNHTFVNGVMVQPGTEVKLMHGQTITLADEEFEFRLF